MKSLKIWLFSWYSNMLRDDMALIRQLHGCSHQLALHHKTYRNLNDKAKCYEAKVTSLIKQRHGDK